MFTTTEVPHRLLRWGANLFLVIGLAALAAVITFAVTGCVSVPEADGGTTYAVPVWSSDPDGTDGPAGPFAFLPEWAKLLLGAGAALAFPRVRQNVAGVGHAVVEGDFKDAGLHVAAMTGLVHTPKPKKGA